MKAVIINGGYSLSSRIMGIEQEEPEPPKLNTDALFNFEHDKKEERKEDISTSEPEEEKVPENKEEQKKCMVHFGMLQALHVYQQ